MRYLLTAAAAFAAGAFVAATSKQMGAQLAQARVAAGPVDPEAEAAAAHLRSMGVKVG